MTGSWVESEENIRGGRAAVACTPRAGTTAALLLLSAILLFPAAAFAQEGKASFSGPAAGEEELLFREIPTVYAASKYEQKTTEAPSSVSVVTADEIRKYGYRTLADILRAQRGFYVNYDRNYHYLGVRGFLRPGDYNTRVLLLVDGHRINDAVYETAYIGTAFPLDVDLIDRVEFIRGPSSSLYGSNAFFGVIHVVTRTGKRVQGAELSGEAGSFGTFKARATWGRRGKGGLQGLISGTWYESDGDDRLYFPEFDDPATNDGVAEDADDDRSGSAFASLSWKDFTLQGAYVKREKRIPTAPWDTFFNDRRTLTEDGMAYLDLKYDRYFGSGVSLLARANLNYYWYFGDYIFDANMDPMNPSLYRNRDETRARWAGAELTVRKQVWKRHRVTFGAEVRDNFHLEQRNFDATAPRVTYLADRRDTSFWAIYLQDEIEIARRLVLNAGLRHDHYSTFGATWNPRIALIAAPRERTTVKLLYGRAFRAPTMYELYYHDGNLTAKANPALDPETIDTYELILEQEIGRNLRVSAAGFRYEVRDLINQVVDPSDGLLVFRNLDSSEAYGGTVEIDGKWDRGFEGRASYTCQMSEDDTTGRELTNSPRHLAKFNLVVPILRERLFAGSELQYTGSRKTVQGNRAGGFWLANLTLTSPRLWDRLDLSASVYNLLDREYGDPGSTEHLQDVIGQDGRTFRLKATLTL